MQRNPLRIYSVPLAISSWLAFAISLTFYWITCDPGVSYWDCPEYVTVASKMEVGHPPGNPVWMLVMHIITLPFAPEHHAFIINLGSGVFMAFAAFFLCRIIFVMLQWFLIGGNLPRVAKRNKVYTATNGVIAFGGALCFSLCDSAWFSAVEAEVYAMSAFLTGLSLWIMVVWWFEQDSGKAFRLLVLLAYIIGLSLGVHQLNLLLIPVYALIILYRKKPYKLGFFSASGWMVGACAIIGLILYGLMRGLMSGAEKFELISANSFGLPYNTGEYLFFILLIFILIVFIVKFPRSYTLWSALFILVGFSAFAIIQLRGSGYPNMNQGVPSDIFSLSSYINREQYPSSPLIYGHTPYSRPLYEESWKEGRPYYNKYLLKQGAKKYHKLSSGAHLSHRSGMLTYKDSAENMKVIEGNHGYLIQDYDFKHRLTPELDMWFPRVTSRNIHHREAYEGWAGMTEANMEKVAVTEALDTSGRFVTRMDSHGARPSVFSYRPTYNQHLKFFFSYQVYYMYLRYLFWNFIGRQNDFPASGEIEHGNFVTGIKAIDSNYLGITEEIPAELWSANKGRNRYYGIPFILGILGLIWLCFPPRCHRRINTMIALLFIMTGLAIVVYLNQNPGEPRERDYTFLANYMAFSIWIAAGIAFLSRLVTKHSGVKGGLVIAMIFSLGIPTLLALENFDDHDRRGRFQTTFFATSLLDTEEPAVVFSQGDNSTFPLWYVSEVLGAGRENTIVDATYLSLPGYIENLIAQPTRGINTLAKKSDIGYGAFILTKIPDDSVSQPVALPEALAKLYADEDSAPVFPSSKIKIPVSPGDSVIINLHDISRGSSYLSFRQLMLLDILASSYTGDTGMALFFPHEIDYSFYEALEPALRSTLFGKIYSPLKEDEEILKLTQSRIDRELERLKNLNTATRYIDPLIADRTRRYRGELIVVARELMQKGDTLRAIGIADLINDKLPYNIISPGNFTLTDSTYYEGKKMVELLGEIYTATGNIRHKERADSLSAHISRIHEEYLNYYRSLNKEQRSTLSPRSRRNLLP